MPYAPQTRPHAASGPELTTPQKKVLFTTQSKHHASTQPTCNNTGSETSTTKDNAMNTGSKKNNHGDYYTKTHPLWHLQKKNPPVLNDLADTQYHSSKGVLVCLARPTRRPNTNKTSTKMLTVKSNVMAIIVVIDQTKRLSGYLETIKQTSPSREQTTYIL